MNRILRGNYGKMREDLGQQLQGSPGQRAESWPSRHVFNNCTVLSDPARYGRCLPWASAAGGSSVLFPSVGLAPLVAGGSSESDCSRAGQPLQHGRGVKIRQVITDARLD